MDKIQIKLFVCFGFEYWPTYSNEKSLKDILAYVK